MKLKKMTTVLLTTALIVGICPYGAVSSAKSQTVTPEVISELIPNKTVTATYKNTGTNDNPSVFLYSFTTDSDNADWSIRLKGDMQYIISDSRTVKSEYGEIRAVGNVPKAATWWNDGDSDFMIPEGNEIFYDSYADIGLEKNKTYYIALVGSDPWQETKGKNINFSITLGKKLYTQQTGNLKMKFAKKTIKAKSVKKRTKGLNIIKSCETSFKIKLISAPKGGKKKVDLCKGTASNYRDVWFKKGAKKGTYKFKVTASANSHFKAESKTVTIKIK